MSKANDTFTLKKKEIAPVKPNNVLSNWTKVRVNSQQTNHNKDLQLRHAEFQVIGNPFKSTNTTFTSVPMLFRSEAPL